MTALVRLGRIHSLDAADFCTVHPIPQRLIIMGRLTPQGSLVVAGILQSCFSARNGTPRQPLLVPAARSCLTLASDVPAAALEGLDAFSHAWVLYIFHANTDAAKSLLAGGGASRAGLKAKIHVPRLDGAKLGVLATRSPHRPVPVGLSLARVGTGMRRMADCNGSAEVRIFHCNPVSFLVRWARIQVVTNAISTTSLRHRTHWPVLSLATIWHRSDPLLATADLQSTPRTVLPVVGRR